MTPFRVVAPAFDSPRLRLNGGGAGASPLHSPAQGGQYCPHHETVREETAQGGRLKLTKTMPANDAGAAGTLIYDRRHTPSLPPRWRGSLSARKHGQNVRHDLLATC